MGSVRLRVVPGQAAAVPGVHVPPWVFSVVAVATLGALAWPASHSERSAERSNLRDSLVGGSLVRLLLVLAVCAAVVLWLRRRRLPAAYRTRACTDGGKLPRAVGGDVVIPAYYNGF